MIYSHEHKEVEFFAIDDLTNALYQRLMHITTLSDWIGPLVSDLCRCGGAIPSSLTMSLMGGTALYLGRDLCQEALEWLMPNSKLGSFPLSVLPL